MQAARLPVGVLAAVAALVAALLLGAPGRGVEGALAATPSVSVAPGFAQKALVHINTARRQRGLRPLRLVSGLGKAATGHARSMGRNGFFSHSYAGRSPSGRIARYYRGSRVGEVILWRAPSLTAARAVSLWLRSPSHRAILFDRGFRDLGVGAVRAANAPGVYRGLDVTIVVADLGRR